MNFLVAAIILASMSALYVHAGQKQTKKVRVRVKKDQPRK